MLQGRKTPIGHGHNCPEFHSQAPTPPRPRPALYRFSHCAPCALRYSRNALSVRTTWPHVDSYLPCHLHTGPPSRLHSGPGAHGEFVCLLFVYILATSKVISGRVPTCKHTWQHLKCCHTGKLGHRHHDLISCWTKQSSAYPNNACLGSYKYQFLSHWFTSITGWIHEVRIA